MKDRPKQLLLRLTEAEHEALEKASTQTGIPRVELARHALRVGLSFATVSHSLNTPRLVLCIERMQAALDVIVHREHADAAGKLDEIAEERMAQFHA